MQRLAALTLFLCVTSICHAQTPYDTLVQQGKTQLQSGNAAAALTSGQQAIKIDPNRWEAYALAGGALMNLKRYEEAEDQFSHAIDHAPQEKQMGLRNLRKQCVLAESGVTAPASPAPVVAQPREATTTQAEIVLWKTIENSTNSFDFDGYLKQYPNGAFAVLANQRAQSLHATEVKKQQDEVQAAQDLKDRLPALIHEKYYRKSYGYLLIRPDGFSYSGDKNFHFSKLDVTRINVKCNDAWCEVETVLSNGETRVFMSVLEESVVTRKDYLKFVTPPGIMINRFKDQWGWTESGSGKGKNPEWLTPPAAAK